MQSRYDLKYPATIIFGVGEAYNIADHIPRNSRTLLLCSERFSRDSKFLGIREKLAGLDMRLAKISGHEAPLEELERVVALGRESSSQTIVAIGGGSVIDLGKAAAGIIPLEGDCADYFHGRKKITDKGLFFAALPTSSGSGAEITCNAVISDSGSRKKQSIRDKFLIADVAIVDPLLTISMPPKQTAYSGLDALTQAIESYVSLSSNEISSALAEQSVRIIFDALPAASSNPDDIQARTAMSNGSLASAMSFSQASLGAVHGLAHPIGSLLSLPHGLVCAILLPHIFRANICTCRDKYSALARACSLKDAEELLEKIEFLLQQLQIPPDFSSFKADPSHLDFIVANCRSRSMLSNPRTLDDNEVRSILLEAGFSCNTTKLEDIRLIDQPRMHSDV